MQDIYTTIASDTKMSKLKNCLDKTGLSDMLKAGGPYTLFAPDNDAFERMNIEKALEDLDNLKSTLTYHLLAGRMATDGMKDIETMGTENGKSLTVNLDEGEMVVDNAKFVKPDVECSNGIIHVIDNVFQPNLSGWYKDE